MNYEKAFNELVRRAESVNRAYKLSKGDTDNGYFVRVNGKLYAVERFAHALGLDVRITYRTEKSRKVFIHSVSMPGYLKVFY